MFLKEYAEVFNGDESWQAIPLESSLTYHWQEKSTYICQPPFFDDMKLIPEKIEDMAMAKYIDGWGYYMA